MQQYVNSIFYILGSPLRKIVFLHAYLAGRGLIVVEFIFSNLMFTNYYKLLFLSVRV